MAPAENLSTAMAGIVEDAFRAFGTELGTFNAAPPGDATRTATFAQRLSQYFLLFWGYEHVMQVLKLGDAAQLARVAAIRTTVANTQTQVQNSQSLQYQASPPQPGAINPGQVATSGYAATANFIAKQKQAFAYSNRMWELTNAGIPFIQAQLIARQETGYQG